MTRRWRLVATFVVIFPVSFAASVVSHGWPAWKIHVLMIGILLFYIPSALLFVEQPWKEQPRKGES